MTCRSVTCRHYPAYKQVIFSIGEPMPDNCIECPRRFVDNKFELGDPTAKREF